MKTWGRVLVGVLTACCLPGAASAESEVDILLNKLVDKGVLSNVEAGQIRREISETKEARNKELAKEIVPASARNWKWGGDIRLRDEIRNRQTTGADSHRTRIRFRYGAEGKVNDQLKAKFRIATGDTSDPISTNQTFNTNFLKKTIVLDLANLEYSPMLPSPDTKLSIVGGIMENPLWTVDPMVWDGDLSWDGFAFKASQKLGDAASVFTNNGIFLLDSDESEASALWVAQGGVALTPFTSAEEELLKNLKLTTGVAWHDYENTFTSAANKAGTDPLTREGDNVTCCEFNQLNPSVELASSIGGVPFSFFGDWVRNLSVGRDNNGYAVGVKVGKATIPWDLLRGWEAGYMFERLERDAVYDEFADSDFGGGGANRRGNVLWFTMATLKNSTFGVKMFFRQDQITNSGAGATLVRDFREDRIQLDWVTKF
jgi:hypothetical protein